MEQVVEKFFNCYKEELKQGNDLLPVTVIVGFSHELNKPLLMPALTASSSDEHQLVILEGISTIIRAVQENDTELYYLISAKEGYMSQYDMNEFTEEEIEDLKKEGLVGKNDPLNKHVLIINYEVPGTQTSYFYEIINDELQFMNEQVIDYEDNVEGAENYTNGFDSFIFNKNLKK